MLGIVDSARYDRDNVFTRFISTEERLLEAPKPSGKDLSTELPMEIIGRLENLYPKLSPADASASLDTVVGPFGAPILEMPTVDVLSTRVSQCSFKVFASAEEYAGSVRAKEFVSWIAPRGDTYRIYFNTVSKKVYVDLNGKRWSEKRSKVEDERLFCDILRTLIFVLTCEVELFEAREAEAKADAGANAVTSEVIEVVIP